MISDILLFSLSLLLTLVLIFILIYFLITLSDLECDYLNATECCAKLNFVSDVETSNKVHVPYLCDTNRFPLAVEHSQVMAAVGHRLHVVDSWALGARRRQLAHVRLSHPQVPEQQLKFSIRLA